jgi:hypothetical protein
MTKEKAGIAPGLFLQAPTISLPCRPVPLF